MSAVEEHFIHRLLDRSSYDFNGEAGLLAWTESLVAIGDASALPMLLDVIDESLEGVRSWDAVDAALDGICTLGRAVGITTLARLMAHPDVQLRFRAAERLLALGDTEQHLRSVAFGKFPETAKVAAAWALVKVGYTIPALRYLGSHAMLLAPRFVGLGERGVRALCLCSPALFGDRLEDVAALLARKRQWVTLYTSLAEQHGSELAALALDHIAVLRGRRPRVNRHQVIQGFGEEPLTSIEIRELVAGGLDQRELLGTLAGRDLLPKPKRHATPNGAVEDTLWHPPEDKKPEAKRKAKQPCLETNNPERC
jgi:hypothetical protein